MVRESVPKNVKQNGAENRFILLQALAEKIYASSEYVIRLHEQPTSGGQTSRRPKGSIAEYSFGLGGFRHLAYSAERSRHSMSVHSHDSVSIFGAHPAPSTLDRPQRIWSAGARAARTRFGSNLRQSQSAVAASLCRRTPKHCKSS